MKNNLILLEFILGVGLVTILYVIGAIFSLYLFITGVSGTEEAETTLKYFKFVASGIGLLSLWLLFKSIINNKKHIIFPKLTALGLAIGITVAIFNIISNQTGFIGALFINGSPLIVALHFLMLSYNRKMWSTNNG